MQEPSHSRRHSEPVQDILEAIAELSEPDSPARRHSLADGEEVLAFPTTLGDGEFDNIISELGPSVSAGTTQEDLTDGFDFGPEDISSHLLKVPKRSDPIRDRLSAGSGGSGKTKAPLLLRLADLPSVGISLEQFTSFNNDDFDWADGTPDTDFYGMSSIPEEPASPTTPATPAERWDEEFEFSNDVKLSGIKQHIRRPSNTSVGGGPTLITPHTQVLSPTMDVGTSKSSCAMFFDHLAQRWEGGDVDLSGFDEIDVLVSPRSKLRTQGSSSTVSDVKSPPKETYDNDFCTEEYDSVQLPEKHRGSGSWMEGMLSKFTGDKGPKQDSETQLRATRRESKGPLLIRPDDVDSAWLKRTLSSRSMGALSDELSGLEGSDSNSRAEEWDDELEGQLDMEKIKALINADRILFRPIGQLPTSPGVSEDSLSPNRQGIASVFTSKRPSIVRASKITVLSPRKSGNDKRFERNGSRSKLTLITPDDLKTLPHSTEMVFDKERNVWIEHNCTPVDLEEILERSRRKKSQVDGTFDRRSRPEDFVLDPQLKEIFYSSEEQHNDMMRAFLGAKYFAQMVREAAYRLSMRSPLKFNPEEAVRRTLTQASKRASTCALEEEDDDILNSNTTPGFNPPPSSSSRFKGRERSASNTPFRTQKSNPETGQQSTGSGMGLPAGSTTPQGSNGVNLNERPQSRPSSASTDKRQYPPAPVAVLRSHSGGTSSMLKDVKLAVTVNMSSTSGVDSKPRGGKKSRAHLHEKKAHVPDKNSVTFADLSKTGHERLTNTRVSDIKVRVFKDIWEFAADHFESPPLDTSSAGTPHARDESV